MPLPAIQNVERRGAVYYWRRTVRFQDGKPFTLRLSLRTTNQSIARRMGCAMTAKSEALKMTLGQSAPSAKLTVAQKNELYRKALEQMRDHLEVTHVQFQRSDEDPSYAIKGLVEIYEVLFGDFHVHGVPDNVGTREHIEARFPHLNEEQRETLIAFFAGKPHFGQGSRRWAREDLQALGVMATEDNVDIARKLTFEGKVAAAAEYRKRLEDPLSVWTARAPNIDSTGAPVFVAETAKAVVHPPKEIIAEPWATMTPTVAAARFITDNPKIMGDAKRRARWTEKTRNQFLAAARLLEKSYGAQPLRLITRDDVVRLNEHFSRLPTSHHKPRHHDSMTLEQICLEAAAQVEKGDRDKSTIGLGPTTTNRHFLFLKELVEWMRKQVPTMAAIDWSDFFYEDNRDAREQRDAYTEEEGRALFRLPIWTGSESQSRRLNPGPTVWHDAGYWVPAIAWYTGCRRGEICQLTLADICREDGIWYFQITDENGGSLKNRSAKRAVPFAAELIRLGLPEYVEALRAAEETMLFPELRNESGKRNLGDVYYKNWWTKIAKRLEFIEPGQALHSFRHTVTTQLKERQVFLEVRADLVGHAMSGETAGRYSKAASLRRLKEAVDQIPKVTDRLPALPIRLLAPSALAPRPARPKRVNGTSSPR